MATWMSRDGGWHNPPLISFRASREQETPLIERTEVRLLYDHATNRFDPFSFFFPEKREFFLENTTIFQFGSSSRGFRAASGGEVIPIFSRRMGISEGRLIPILGGVRLSGTLGKYRLGMLSMQADEFEEVP